MYKTWSKLGVAGALSAVLALTAGCSQTSEPPAPDPSASSSESSIEDLIAAAKAEGSVTVYTTIGAAAAKVQVEAFTEKYGIRADMVRLAGGQMDQRFTAEVNSSGGTSADILFTTNNILISDSMKSGALIALDKAEIPGFPWDFPKQFLPADGSAITLLEPVGIAYNTDLVKGDDIPRSWTDLLDAKWKGKIGVSNPAASVAQTAAWAVIEDKVGDDFLTKLGTQGLKVYAASAPVNGALGAGEILLAANLTATSMVSAKQSGAPVGIAFPDDTSGIEVSAGIVAKAAHPNAARLFALYAMSEEGALVLAKVTEAVSPYDTADLPKNYTAPDLVGATKLLAEVSSKLGVK